MQNEASAKFISALDLLEMTDAERLKYMRTDEVLEDPMDIDSSNEISWDLDQGSLCVVCGAPDEHCCCYLYDNDLFEDITKYF